MKIKTVLTIAGSDPSGGAGIQADIKTITVHKMYAMSVISAITIQNTKGVRRVAAADSDIFYQQLDCVLDDIIPDAVKIGMIPGKEHINIINDAINKYNLKNIILDPVLVSSSGTELIEKDDIPFLCSSLFSQCTLVTPNIPEAEYITGKKITKQSDLKQTALELSDRYKTAFLLKGGHFDDNISPDWLSYSGRAVCFLKDKINNPNTHGSGCTLSSAIACGLADGKSIESAVCDAKEYLTGAIKYGLDIGHGTGPLFHNYL